MDTRDAIAPSTPAVAILAGLGNPGRKYENTRHNIGFEIIERIGQALNAGPLQEKFDAYYGKHQHAGHSLVLLKPLTYMNNSGRSIAAAAKFYKTPIDRLLLICDDLALPLGKLRLRRSGSSGGQKGLQSVIDQIGSSDFARLRIGIGSTPPGWDTADYVLSRFTPTERPAIETACQNAVDAAFCWLTDGVEAAMNRFNR